MHVYLFKSAYSKIQALVTARNLCHLSLWHKKRTEFCVAMWFLCLKLIVLWVRFLYKEILNNGIEHHTCTDMFFELAYEKLQVLVLHGIMPSLVCGLGYYMTLPYLRV